MRVHITQFIFPLCCMALAAFLAWTAMNGERGQKRLSERQETFVKLVQTLADEAESRDALASSLERTLAAVGIDPDEAALQILARQAERFGIK